jgi:hypothetical protein
MHQTASCQSAIQVENGTKTLTYYVVPNDVSRNFHQNVCAEAKKVTATGTVQEVAGKLTLTPTKIDLAP